MAWPPIEDGGQLWIGDNGQQLVAGMYGQNPRLVDEARNEQLKKDPVRQKYPRVQSVYQEWIDACKAGKQAGSSFAEHAGPLTIMVLLGNLAVRTGKVLDVDPESGEVATSVPAEYVTPVYRKGWGF
jgi:hypothetical protein